VFFHEQEFRVTALPKLSPSERSAPHFNTLQTFTVPHTHLPLLYTYRRCPYAMRARMALWVAKRDFNAFEIVLRDKPAAMLALSPKGTVPVLQLLDGQVLDESWDIMAWAWSADDSQAWWRKAQTDENLSLLHCNDGDFKRLLDHYKYPERHASESVNRNAARDEAMATFLVPLEARLQSQRYLGGTTACATDLATFPFVRQFAAIGPHWFETQELPALRAWLAAWLNSPLFEACMVKLPPQVVLSFGAWPKSARCAQGTNETRSD
jgi:glutathione S-transferase